MINITFKHMYGKIVWINSVVRIDFNRNYSSKRTKKLLEFLADMPKSNTGRIAEAQRQRQLIAKKSEKYGPSTVYLQVLGSGARGVPNTLYLFTDQKRYLFNCGECTQRLAHEHKVKLSKLEHIFITSKTWRNIGGLPGLSLTLQDVGVPDITLHGPEGLDELYNATSRFVIMKDMNVNMAKCTPAEDFTDSTMTVKYVLLGPHNILQKDLAPAAKKTKRESPHPETEFEEFIHDNTDYYRRDRKSPVLTKENTRQHVKPADKDPNKEKHEKILDDLTKAAQSSVAYICTLKKRLGTLDLEKCVERGVKPGPLLGQLKSGLDVVLPDGAVVRSADVKTPDDPGPVFIVLEVPEISHLREEEFSAHFHNGCNPPEQIPSLVVHFSPPDVFHHPRYQDFMARFGKTTKHLVVNSQNSCLGSEAVHRTQHKLHLLDADVFPLLRDVSIPAVWTSSADPRTMSPAKQKELEELKNKFQNIVSAESRGRGDGGRDHAHSLDVMTGRALSVFHLRPRNELDRSAEPKLHIQEYIQEAMGVDGFVDSLDKFRQLVESVRYTNRSRQNEFPKVVFLGTGSCIPSKTRNTSGILLQVDENRSILLDCGEGTFGQLVRFFGQKRVNSLLRSLKAVYVSHLHADHHIGLIGVLQARREAFQEVNDSQAPSPLYLLAPGQIVSWLSVYDQQFEGIRHDYTLVPNQNLLEGKAKAEEPLSPAVLADLGIERAVTCLVAHCPNAFGLALHLPRHKITYSGDTIPCDELVKIGQDSTLLIHEATMEDELALEARVKMHSTTSQAIDVGRRMRANFTLLTHFSQRYARLPRLQPHVLTDNCNVGIAFDNMQVSMSDLELLPHMYAPLQLMFADHCVELEQKAANRARQKEKRKLSPNIPPAKCKLRSPSSESTKSMRPRRGDNIYRDSNISTKGQSRTSSSESTKSTRRCDNIYRDSNSSRLRFEMYRSIPAVPVKSARSKSCSSSKTSTEYRAPSRSAAKTPSSLNCINVPINKSRTNPDSSARTTAPNVNYVIDSRSKTITSAFRPSTGNKESKSGTSNKNMTGKTQISTNSFVKKGSDLSDRSKGIPFEALRALKWQPRLPKSNLEKPPTHIPRSRSPIQSMKVLLYTSVAASILCHLLFWKLHQILLQNMSSMKWQLISTIIALGYLFWIAYKSSSSRDDDRENVPIADFTTPDIQIPNPRQTLVVQRRSLSSLRESFERKSEGPLHTRARSACRSRTVTEKSGSPKFNIQTKEDLGSYKNVTKLFVKNEKKTDCVNEKAPCYYSGKYNHSSSKSFKPQLEDIKSSFLILNAKKIDANLEGPAEYE